MSATTAALISGGASLLGSVLAKKGPTFGQRMKMQRKWSANEYVWQRKGAERAGFNPLTVLQATGGRSSPAPMQSPSLSRNPIGDAVEAGTSAYFAAKDQEAQAEYDQAKLDLVRKQLEDESNKTVYTENFGFAIPQAETETAQTANASPALSPTQNPHPNGTTTVMGKDGLTRADPEAPVELEGDAWAWARDGSLWPNINEVWNRNMRLPIEGTVKRGQDYVVDGFKNYNPKDRKAPSLGPRKPSWVQ